MDDKNKKTITLYDIQFNFVMIRFNQTGEENDPR